MTEPQPMLGQCVTAESHSALHASMKLIEEDNGAHLIGTVYPGERVDFDHFIVPEAWWPLLPPAEAGLARLRAESEEGWRTFCTGEESEARRIGEERGDLDAARALLNDWFEAWPGDIAALRSRIAELEGLLNSAPVAEFWEAVKIEGAHQVERRGPDHDASKTPIEWVWLIAHLITKAAQAERYGETIKYLHHLVTAGAALARWHGFAKAAIIGELVKPGFNGGVVSAEICALALLLTGTASWLTGRAEYALLELRLATWPQADLDAAYDWAIRIYLSVSDNDDIIVPPRPACLDSLAERPIAGDDQSAQAGALS